MQKSQGDFSIYNMGINKEGKNGSTLAWVCREKPMNDTQESNNMKEEMGGWGHGERGLFAVCPFITLNFKP